ncbi:hypothetical protein MUK42_17101 [Musa troglodytarum]|uniref:Uncharacterized protein n=1 Tax=Musa troglodytarum TaxID=320322 RepID=A0A9E7HYE9_9LILI|nr:hypothetical protein MUK42_17101 [Musa troglodytarum]
MRPSSSKLSTQIKGRSRPGCASMYPCDSCHAKILHSGSLWRTQYGGRFD